jgi:outer membrane protein OmpA-like peptidoglycan-associated protein
LGILPKKYKDSKKIFNELNYILYGLTQADGRYLGSATSVVNITDSVQLKKVKRNALIRLPNLVFTAGLPYLENSGLTDLVTLHELLTKRASMRIEVRGHICCKQNGEDAYNPASNTSDLSVDRAKMVAEYLVSLGIAPERIIYQGYGSSKKLISKDLHDSSAAKLNRRIDVRVIEK